jgi:soluble lytic murein transglycosylase-like protein
VIFAQLLPSYARPYSGIILRVSREDGVDPFLIFAVGDRESRWATRLDSDGTGDGGHGRGIMQIDDRSDGAWLATHDWLDPYTNVKRGVYILKRKLAFFSGRAPVHGYTDGTWVSVDRSAAKLGVSPGKYRDPRPLTGSALWEAAIAAYNSGEGNVLMAIAVGRPAEYFTADGDDADTDGDYVTDVSQRAANLATQYDRATV